MYNLLVERKRKELKKMEKKIWFDMDGTIADLYGVENWLNSLESADPSPYREAKPLVNMSRLARLLNGLQRNGYEIGVCSWLSKGSSAEYEVAVTTAKLEWLGVHLKSVQWNSIDIISYGEPKHNGRDGILFDDNVNIREEWGENAYAETEIFEVLKALKS